VPAVNSKTPTAITAVLNAFFISSFPRSSIRRAIAVRKWAPRTAACQKTCTRAPMRGLIPVGYQNPSSAVSSLRRRFPWSQACPFSESDPRDQHGAFAGSPLSEPRGAASAAGRDCDPCAARAVACPPRAQLGTQLRLGAAPCGSLAGFLSVSGLSMHVANVGVAGSSPVSCSSFRRPGHDLGGRGDAFAGHVAPWGSRGRRRSTIAAVSRGCGGGRCGFDDLPPWRARACPLRAQAAGSSRW
jgi:hypothetical protein